VQARTGRRLLGMVVLFLFCQSVELAEQDDELVHLSSDGGLEGLFGESESLVDVTAPDTLAAELQAEKPGIDITPMPSEESNMDSIPKNALARTADLANQLSSMTDAQGKAVIQSNVASTANVSLAPALSLPTDGATANAMMAGQQSEESNMVTIPPPKEVTFRSIPFFKFSHLGQTMTGMTQEQCENSCKGDTGCMSFSYQAKSESCLQSQSAIRYDVEFDFFAKKKKKVEGQAKFRHMGAMKYAYSGASTEVTPSSGVSKGKCKEICRKDEKCNSFTYRSTDRLCLRSSEQLGYEDGWTYFEKSGAAVDVAMTEKYGKETAAPMKALINEFRATGSAKLKELEHTPSAASNMHLIPESQTGSNMHLIPESQPGLASNAALNPQQAAYLTKSVDGSISATRDAIVKQALMHSSRALTQEERARNAISTIAGERAQKAENVHLAREMKGKDLYKSDLKSSQMEAKEAMESGEKKGWKANEQKQKDKEKAHEASQKEAIESAAKEAREKTALKTTALAQKELEEQDAVKSQSDQIKISQDAEMQLKTASDGAKKQVKFLVDEQTRGEKMMADGGDTSNMDALSKTVEQAKEDIDKERKVQTAANIKLAGVQAELPNVVKAAANEKAAIDQAKEAVQMTDSAATNAVNASEANVAKLAAANAKNHLAMVKNAATYAGEKMKKLEAEQIQLHDTLTQSKEKESEADTEKTKDEAQLGSVRASQAKLEEDGKVLLGSSQFQAKQELANELKLKKEEVEKQTVIVAAKEVMEKQLEKVKLYRHKIALEEEVAAEQANEKKVKAAAQQQAEATQEAQAVKDKHKVAEKDITESQKMLGDAELAVATAATVDEKVKAAQQESNARLLKASSEQKLTALQPDVQNAEKVQHKEEEKVQQLQETAETDEKKVEKSAVVAQTLQEETDKVVQQGPVEVARTDEKLIVKAEKEAATLAETAILAPANTTKPPAAATPAATPAPEDQTEIKTVPSAILSPGKGSGGGSAAPLSLNAIVEKEKGIKSTLKMEKGALQQMKNVVKAKLDEKAMKENRAKQAARQVRLDKDKKEQRKLEEKQLELQHNATLAKMHEATEKKKAELMSRVTQSALGSAGGKKDSLSQSCTVGSDGKVMKLEARENCAKTKEKQLETLEISAKENSKRREVKMKTREGAEKAKEKTRKDEMREKKDKAAELETKETAKKKKEEEVRKKEIEKKADARKETEHKEKTQKKAEKTDKEAKTKEGKTKSKEKDTKEKKDKEDKKEQEAKELKQKTTEKETKASEKKTKETAIKAAQEKKIKETETKEKEKKTAEKSEKEKATKATEKEKEAKKEKVTKEKAEKKDAEEKKEKKEAKEKETKAKEKTDKEEKITKSKEKTEKEKSTKEKNNKREGC